MSSHAEVLAFVKGATWGLLPDRLAAYVEALEQSTVVPQAVSRPRRATTGPVDSIGVIPIHGPVTNRPGPFSFLFGGTSIVELRRALGEALSNRHISTIVLDVDSPGGEVDGTPELATEIFAVRGQKPIIAVVNTLAASAAYWLAAQADEIVISPSAQAGSIGVWVLHQDLSGMFEKMGVQNTLLSAGEHKTDANPFEKLATSARKDLQSHIDSIMRDFLTAVARGRGTTPALVKASYGSGKLYNARDAVRLGLADRIGTLDQVLDRGASRRGLNAQAQADRDLLDVTLAVMEHPATGPSSEERATALAQVQADREYLDDMVAQGEHNVLLDELEALDPEWRRHG